MRCSVSKEPAEKSADFRHATYFTPLSRFCKQRKVFFSLTQEQAPYANEKAVFKNAQLSSLFEEKSMNHFEQRLADAFTPSEARQMFKLPRISVFASRQRDFF
ncbi:MAG: hypothetical protein IKS92_06265 [Victivallales bacterium]|nr:hypothetical protein [Victivallales bacterium]